MSNNTAKRYRTFNGMISYDYFKKNNLGQIENTFTEKEFTKFIISELIKEKSITWFSIIAHNKDILDEETAVLKPYHIHFVIRFNNARTLNSLINSLSKTKISSRNLTATQSIASSLLYLTHTTIEAIKQKKKLDTILNL